MSLKTETASYPAGTIDPGAETTAITRGSLIAEDLADDSRQPLPTMDQLETARKTGVRECLALLVERGEYGAAKMVSALLHKGHK